MIFKSLVSKSTWWNEGNQHFGADRNGKLQNITLAYSSYHGSHYHGRPHSHHISRAYLNIDSLFQTPNLHPQPPLCTLIWQVQAEAQVSQLGAAGAASNPGNSAVKRDSIKKKKPKNTAPHLCLLYSHKSIYKTQSKLIWPFDYNWKLRIARRKQRQHRTSQNHIKNS